MLVALLAGLGCCAPCHARWDVAYTARFYYPPGGKRVSHRQVYLSDLHGRHRKQLTFGKDEPSQVRWVGRDHLAWLRSKGGRTSIQMLDLRSWKIQTFGGFNKAEPGEDWPGFGDRVRWSMSVALRGRPVYSVDGSLQELTPKGLRRRSKEQVLRYRQEMTESGEVWHIPGQPSVTCRGEDNHNFITRFPDGGAETEGRATMTRLGKTYAFEFPGVVQYVLPGRDPSHAWIMSGSYAASAGSYEFLFDVDWRTGKARRVAVDVIDIDFDPEGRYFSALEGGRPLSAYGSRRQVWTASIYVGELPTGRRWPVASGLVYGENVVLRPSR